MTTESHAQCLDQNYRYQRHVYDLSREYYLLGRQRMIADLAPPQGGSVLEIGCGTALNLIRARQLFPATRCFGVDLSRLMLETAEASLARRGLSNQIRLGYGDATNFDAGDLFDVRAFDRIFFSYSLSMIPPWKEALAHSLSLLSTHGQLVIVDFGGCERLPAAFKHGLYAWLGRFHVTPREGLKEFLDDLALRHDLTISFKRLYRGYSNYAVLQRR